MPNPHDQSLNLNVNLTVNVPEVRNAFQQILTRLDQIQATQEKILMTDQEFAAILTKIDQATTKTGDNVAAIGKIADTISTEVDALVAGMQSAGVSQALIDQATALGTKADAASAASDALVPVLQGIATKASNPVPVPVPPPPPPPAPTPAP